MAAVHLISCDSEAVSKHPALELDRKQPVTSADDGLGRHVWPLAKGPRFLKRGIRLTGLAPGQHIGDHVVGDVVKVLGHRIEVAVESIARHARRPPVEPRPNRYWPTTRRAIRPVLAPWR